MKNQFRFNKPPAPLRRARLDNLALIPGDLLPYRIEWQAVANTPPGAPFSSSCPRIIPFRSRPCSQWQSYSPVTGIRYV